MYVSCFLNKTLLKMLYLFQWYLFFSLPQLPFYSTCVSAPSRKWSTWGNTKKICARRDMECRCRKVGYCWFQQHLGSNSVSKQVLVSSHKDTWWNVSPHLLWKLFLPLFSAFLGWPVSLELTSARRWAKSQCTAALEEASVREMDWPGFWVSKVRGTLYLRGQVVSGCYWVFLLLPLPLQREEPISWEKARTKN